MSKPIYCFDGYNLRMFEIHKETEAQLKLIPIDAEGHVRVQTVNKNTMDKPDFRGGIWTFDVEVLKKHLAAFKVSESEKLIRRLKNIEEIEKGLKNG